MRAGGEMVIKRARGSAAGGCDLSLDTARSKAPCGSTKSLFQSPVSAASSENKPQALFVASLCFDLTRGRQIGITIPSLPLTTALGPSSQPRGVLPSAPSRKLLQCARNVHRRRSKGLRISRRQANPSRTTRPRRCGAGRRRQTRTAYRQGRHHGQQVLRPLCHPRLHQPGHRRNQPLPKL